MTPPPLQLELRNREVPWDLYRGDVGIVDVFRREFSVPLFHSLIHTVPLSLSLRPMQWKCPFSNFVCAGIITSLISSRSSHPFCTMRHWWMSPWRLTGASCRPIKSSYLPAAPTLKWVWEPFLCLSPSPVPVTFSICPEAYFIKSCKDFSYYIFY